MTDCVPATTPAVIVERDERTVRLGDIGIARENLRFNEPPDDDIPTLAATMKAAGQLQRLTVRPGCGKKEEPWMALDGRRRRLALGLLLDAGEIDEDYPVTVYVETDPARQAAAVLLTNTAVPVHVADIIAAIGRMLKSRLTVSAIAGALGYAEIEVKRLAALAGLPPAALVALKAGRMTLKQARLLARLPDKAEQAEIADAALNGQGFQDWRIIERLDEGRVTVRDRRCALVDPLRYGEAGGRTEADLFGELAPVLLDPDILTDLWVRRARGIAAVFEAEGIAVHVTAGPEPDLPDDLEPLGYVYGGQLPAEDMARYRAQREVFNERAEAARQVLSAAGDPETVDAAIIAMIRARVTADQHGGQPRDHRRVRPQAGGVQTDVRPDGDPPPGHRRRLTVRGAAGIPDLAREGHRGVLAGVVRPPRGAGHLLAGRGGRGGAPERTAPQAEAGRPRPATSLDVLKALRRPLLVSFAEPRDPWVAKARVDRPAGGNRPTCTSLDPVRIMTPSTACNVGDASRSVTQPRHPGPARGQSPSMSFFKFANVLKRLRAPARIAGVTVTQASENSASLARSTSDTVRWRRPDACAAPRSPRSPSVSGGQGPQLVTPEASDFVQMVLGREAGGLGVRLQPRIVGVKGEGGVQQRGFEQDGDLLRQPEPITFPRSSRFEISDIGGMAGRQARGGRRPAEIRQEG